MNREISEKRIEKEISILSSSELQIKVTKVNKDDYSVDIIFKGSELNNQLDGEIEFLIIFGTDFPYKSPKVFCLTQFSTPSLADGRDLIQDLLGQTWIPSFKIIDIISKIPEFVNDYIKNLQNGQLILSGNYYLGDRYDLAMLELLPVCINISNIVLRKVKEKIIIDEKEKEVERWLMVSDLYLCLFESEKWSRNNLILVFWTNLRALVTIRKNVKEEIVKFFFKQKHRKNTYELALNFDDSDILIGSILKTMQTLGINYKVKKQGPPKTGSLPSINIEEVEKIIKEKEPLVEENPNLESVNYLMDLYQNAIEYYSATNDDKYEYYLSKVHATLNCPRMETFLSNHKINVAKSPRLTTISTQENKVVSSISLNYQNVTQDEEVKEKKDTGPEVKTITEVVGSGVIIEQNDNNDFLNKLTNNQDDEEEDEEDD